MPEATVRAHSVLPPPNSSRKALSLPLPDALPPSGPELKPLDQGETQAQTPAPSQPLPHSNRRFTPSAQAKVGALRRFGRSPGPIASATPPL